MLGKRESLTDRQNERKNMNSLIVVCFFNLRSAIYANRLYLSLIYKSNPSLLATNGDPTNPHIIGHVRIHPTAQVDPSATVSVCVCVCVCVWLDAAVLMCFSHLFHSLVLMCMLDQG